MNQQEKDLQEAKEYTLSNADAKIFSRFYPEEWELIAHILADYVNHLESTGEIKFTEEREG